MDLHNFKTLKIIFHLLGSHRLIYICNTYIHTYTLYLIGKHKVANKTVNDKIKHKIVQQTVVIPR